MTEASTLFVHGVGLWPGVFQPVVTALERIDPAPTSLWTRPGYRTGQVSDHPPSPQQAPVPPGFDRQVELLAAEVERRSPVVVVGVSGGATLALAAAIQGPSGLVGVVTHEPLIGSLAPALHRRVASAGQALATHPGPEAAVGFLRNLYGSGSWDRLPEPARRWSAFHHQAVCAEVAQFASFAPTREQLAHLAVPNLTTVGSRSSPVRHRVADLLISTGSGRTTGAVIDDCGHLAPVDAAEAFAAVVGSFRTELGLVG
jgi:pimeloyl-ACP methyl ester carboxylesterase